MHRLLVLVVIAACGESVDDRPRTLEYITKAVLEPTCASAECHSSFAQQGRPPKDPGDVVVPIVFDTVMAARRSIQKDGQLVNKFEANADEIPTLIKNLTVEQSQPFAPRMPLDKPLPQEDIELINDWIKLGGPGACVNDQKFAGAVGSCNGHDLYACDSETRSFDKVIATGVCNLIPKK